ncbi:MAG TPA: PilZ domain-containing protein [Candidatus Sulfotelmatobacter sp.]|nr:PilZ domain-containing protein [Candidatus Sulfotelmatobacter sp.]
MHEHGNKKPEHTGSANFSPSVKEAERRGTERHTFTASAEVVELTSGARFAGRTTDLGPGGCFVDTKVPFPVGSKLKVNLQRGKSSFETAGTVVYSQPGLGMGVAFDGLDQRQQAALNAWLEDVTGQRFPAAHYEDRRKQPQYAANASGPEHAALVRLVRLMIGKGILTEAEGSSVLIDPVL